MQSMCLVAVGDGQSYNNDVLDYFKYIQVG